MMNPKQVIKALLDGKPADRFGFWAGGPNEAEIYYEFFNVETADELFLKFRSDFAHMGADWYAWANPDRPIFDYYGGKSHNSLNAPGVFADCEDVKEIEDFDWPDPDDLDFSLLDKELDRQIYSDKAIFSGCWSMFYHDMCSFFGMDNYFVKMHTDPKVVEAATSRIIDYYLAANKKCFEAVGSKIDAFFFGNDFGTQQGMMISPECFDKFIMPGFKKLIDVAKSFDIKVVLHSCGAIGDVIPKLIDAGIDGLHPLQAKAKGMDAETLAREYKKDLVFIGGVDTQELLPFGTTEQVKNEVRRLKKIFGERFVVSPSHEAILPEVKPENVLAMIEAAFEC